MTEVQPISDALTRLEEVVDRGLSAFMEVGAALIAIRDSGMYRQRGGDRFEDYCEERFQLSRRRAYQLMEAAETVESMCKILHTPPPAVESQARELARLPDPEARAEVWADVQAAATPEAPVTATTVREAVNRHPSAPPPRPKAAPVRAVGAAQAAPPIYDDDTGARWQCAGCNRWYSEDVSDCPECQPAFWPDDAPAAPTPIVAAPAPDVFDLPPAHLNTEQKAFYQIAKCAHMTGLDPSTIAATPSAVMLGPSVKELGNLAEWLARVVEALRARQERPDLRAVK